MLVVCLKLSCYTHNNRPFSKPSTFSWKGCDFDEMNDFCILQGGAVTFFRCGGQMQNHLCPISSRFRSPKILKSV